MRKSLLVEAIEAHQRGGAVASATRPSRRDHRPPARPPSAATPARRRR
ncbi:hypothetical protein QJS66_00120 [Kocuria rhizophila]|nr:hypothetical protein QJS66_00120 [Kocuria rhizophila]